MADSLWLAVGGLVVGVCVCYLYFRQYVSPAAFAKTYAPREELDAQRTLAAQAERAQADSERRLAATEGDLARLARDLAAAQSATSVAQEDHRASTANVAALTLKVQRLEDEAARSAGDLDDARHEVRQNRDRLEAERAAHADTRQALTEASARLEALDARLAGQREEFARMQAHAREEFANLSTRLLKDSSEELRVAHRAGLAQLLDPMRTKLSEFQETVERKFADEGKDKAVLRMQIERLTDLNQDLSREARQLTQALKGDSKTQGDWGEHRLEGLLEAAGLVAGTHFDPQVSLFSAEHDAQQRPDCVVRLPQGRCLVIDAKVSLTAYEQFCGSETDEDARRHLQAHVQSVRAHIRGLSAKRYQELPQLDCPDYVLLFVPLEPAFITALRERGTLFTEALEAKVVLVSPSTLLATMRTVSYIWQQEDQRANAQEIADVGRKLYDKFVGFVDDMNAVGKQLNAAQVSYDAAMNKLSRSPKAGTTLVARANQLRALGVDGKRLLAEEADAS